MREVTAEVQVGLSNQKGGHLTPGYEVEAFAYYEDDVTPLTVLGKELLELTGAGDKALFVLTGIPMAGTPGARKLHFGVRRVEKKGGIVYVEAEDVESFETYTF